VEICRATIACGRCCAWDSRAPLESGQFGIHPDIAKIAPQYILAGNCLDDYAANLPVLGNEENPVCARCRLTQVFLC